MKGQATWCAALLDPDCEVPAGLVTWNGSDPAQRFAIYRNKVMVSLMEALADSFPVCQARVGAPQFRDLARAFVRSQPPRTPVLTRYGQGFAGFLADSGLAVTWPYLPDLARLEWACLEALHAAEAPPLDQELLTAALGRPETLPSLRRTLHPSLATLDSPFAVVSLWAAQQGEGAPPDLDPDHPEHAWILRRGRSVLVLQMTDGDCRFVRALQAGLPLGEATRVVVEGESAEDGGPDRAFDLTRCLTVLLSEQALTGLSPATVT